MSTWKKLAVAVTSKVTIAHISTTHYHVNAVLSISQPK